MTETSCKSHFEIGTYRCPTKERQVTLELPAPLASLDWPVIVERCSACGRKHVLQYGDIRHPPALGYE
jgi:hypothetical protein